MEEQNHLSISINTVSLLASYLAEIQNLFDVTTLVVGAAENATEERYRKDLAFLTFHPANDRRLDFHQARQNSRVWLLRSFLSDSVDATGSFLDECSKVCALFRLGGKGEIKGQEFKDIFEADWNRFHRLGFPDKLDHLRKEFGVESPLEKHFLSLNQARNCLVHRRGIVAPRDTNEEGNLKILWWVVELVAKPSGEAEEIVIENPTTVEAGWSIFARATNRERSFDVGERIELSVPELYRSISTLYSFADSLVKSVESYGASQGTERTGE